MAPHAWTRVPLLGDVKYSGNFTLETRQLRLTSGSETIVSAFRFTQTGIELYEAKPFGTASLRAFTGDTSETIPVLRATDGTSVLSPKLVPLTTLLTSGENLWLMCNSTVTPAYTATGRAMWGFEIFKSLWTGQASIYNIMLGLPTYDNQGFGAYSTVINFTEGAQYMRLPIDYTIDSDNEITLTFSPEKATEAGKELMRQTMVQLVVAGLANIGTVSNSDDASVIYYMDPDYA